MKEVQSPQDGVDPESLRPSSLTSQFIENKFLSKFRRIKIYTSLSYSDRSFSVFSTRSLISIHILYTNLYRCDLLFLYLSHFGLYCLQEVNRLSSMPMQRLNKLGICWSSTYRTMVASTCRCGNSETLSLGSIVLKLQNSTIISPLLLEQLSLKTLEGVVSPIQSEVLSLRTMMSWREIQSSFQVKRFSSIQKTLLLEPSKKSRQVSKNLEIAKYLFHSLLHIPSMKKTVWRILSQSPQPFHRRAWPIKFQVLCSPSSSQHRVGKKKNQFSVLIPDFPLLMSVMHIRSMWSLFAKLPSQTEDLEPHQVRRLFLQTRFLNQINTILRVTKLQIASQKAPVGINHTQFPRRTRVLHGWRELMFLSTVMFTITYPPLPLSREVEYLTMINCQALLRFQNLAKEKEEAKTERIQLLLLRNILRMKMEDPRLSFLSLKSTLLPKSNNTTNFRIRQKSAVSKTI